MATDTKILLSKTNIRTMKKDIKRLREVGATKINGEMIKPKTAEQITKTATEQPNFSIIKNKPEQKITPIFNTNRQAVADKEEKPKPLPIDQKPSAPTTSGAFGKVETKPEQNKQRLSGEIEIGEKSTSLKNEGDKEKQQQVSPIKMVEKGHWQLKKTPSAANENPHDAVKKEKGERKKFMEDVEEWAKSTNN